MIILFHFFATISSLKPIYLIAGFENSPIYSKINDFSLYPECPTNVTQVLIKDYKIFNTNFLSHYPNCVAKLLRVRFNANKVEQLPGITTYSTSVSNTSIFSENFNEILIKFRQLGYQDNINLFSVGYNHFFHPVGSYSVYNDLKKSIEQVTTQTGEKSIIISFDQGSSFTSIFLSNYSKSEWVKQYIDCVIFLSPTFGGLPSISNIIAQKFSPFPSNDEFKKSFMRMPGLQLSLPNYAVFENFTFNLKLRENFIKLNASQIFEFLKAQSKFDDESEKIFKTSVEQYLKVPFPEPPVPSYIIISKKTAKTAINSIISIDNESLNDQLISISFKYACSNWKFAKCVESDKPSQFIFECINGRTHKKLSSLRTAEDAFDSYSTIAIASGIYIDSGYVTSHTITTSEFTYAGLDGAGSYPIKNAFDGNKKTYYISNTSNSETFNNTLYINFTDTVTLEAILYDTAYTTNKTTNVRKYYGFPTVLYAYTASEDDSQYTLAAIFAGEPAYPLERAQFVFPKSVRCDRLKLEFVNVTEQLMITPYDKRPMIADLTFLRRLFISGDSIYNNDGYLKFHLIDRSEYTYTSSEEMSGYPISNAFDDDLNTYYISNTASNWIEISFSRKLTVFAFLFDSVKLTVGGSEVLQGFPTKINIYGSIGDEQLSLKTKINGPGNPAWNRVCFSIPDLFECDKIKIEFVEVGEQTINGNSANLVVAGLNFIENKYDVEFTMADFNHSSLAFLVTYSIDPSNFTCTGTEANSKYPMTNMFDGNQNTFYVSNQAISESIYNELTISFVKTVSIEDIVFSLSFMTNKNVRNYVGYPKTTNVYTSIGNEPFSIKKIFYGTPISPATRIQFHFDEPIQCDKLKLEFIDASEQSLVGSNSKNIVISNLFFIPTQTYSSLYPSSVASEKYMNDTYIQSIMIDSSEFSFTIDQEVPGFPKSNIFDKNSSNFYLSNVPINLTTHNFLDINFNEIVGLEAILLDTVYFTSGYFRTFQGCPTGIKIYSSTDNHPYDFNYFFVGDPAFEWTRIQFAFPDFLFCDKLRIEFVHVTRNGNSGASLSLVIPELYLIRAQIPATPTFSPSQSPHPSETPSFSPTQSETPAYLPTEIPISDVCNFSTSCKYEGDKDHQILVTINTSVFTNIQNEDNGGAILLKNAGLVCTEISFSGCKTNSNSGGGGIYIRNEIEMQNTISLNNVNFTNCMSSYGGAIFIYSDYVESKVEINSCVFTSNQATTTTKSSSSSMIGGSAIFISSKLLSISDCIFNKNIGENQLNLQNKFKSNEHKTNLGLLQKTPKTTCVVRYCRFVIDRQTKSSLYYLSGENGVSSFVRNSIFVGNLNAGYYHIDGKAETNHSPKIVVERCKFSTDHSRAFKMNKGHNYISALAQKQTFNYEEDKEISKDMSIFAITAAVIVGILVIVIIVVLKKQIETSRMVAENNNNNA